MIRLVEDNTCEKIKKAHTEAVQKAVIYNLGGIMIGGRAECKNTDETISEISRK